MAIIDNRTDKEKNLEKVIGNIFFLYIGIPSLFFIVTIETEFNASFFFAFKYLSLPISVIIIFLGAKYQHIIFYESNGRLFRSMMAFLAIPIAILMSVGYVSFFNAIIPPQETVCYKGIIKEKFISGASRKSYVIALDIDDDERKFSVSEEEYNKIKLGQFYKIKMKKGGLGIVYKTNW